MGIFGPANSYTRDIVSSITAKLDIPHIEYTYHRTDELKVWANEVNVYPDNKYIAKVSYF